MELRCIKFTLNIRFIIVVLYLSGRDERLSDLIRKHTCEIGLSIMNCISTFWAWCVCEYPPVRMWATLHCTCPENFENRKKKNRQHFENVERWGRKAGTFILVDSESEQLLSYFYLKELKALAHFYCRQPVLFLQASERDAKGSERF